MSFFSQYRKSCDYNVQCSFFVKNFISELASGGIAFTRSGNIGGRKILFLFHNNATWTLSPPLFLVVDYVRVVSERTKRFDLMCITSFAEYVCVWRRRLWWWWLDRIMMTMMIMIRRDMVHCMLALVCYGKVVVVMVVMEVVVLFFREERRKDKGFSQEQVE